MAKSSISFQSNDEKKNIKRSTEVVKIQRKFYDSENNLVLPRDANRYYNWKCVAFNESTLDTKLRELGYLLSHGFDFRQSILDYKKGQEAYVKISIPQTFIFYIMYFRYRDYYHFISEILEKLSEKKLIQLFIDELNLLYNHFTDEINCLFWTEEIVKEAVEKVDNASSEKDKLLSLITSSEMTKMDVNKRDL